LNLGRTALLVVDESVLLLLAAVSRVLWVEVLPRPLYENKLPIPWTQRVPRQKRVGFRANHSNCPQKLGCSQPRGSHQHYGESQANKACNGSRI